VGSYYPVALPLASCCTLHAPLLSQAGKEKRATARVTPFTVRLQISNGYDTAEAVPFHKTFNPYEQPLVLPQLMHL
jgi:hypothetical protein